MAFGSNIRCSKGKDDKDYMQRIHISEARWAEVVKGFRGSTLRLHLQKHPSLYTSRPERRMYN